MINITTYQAGQQALWDAFVQASRNGTFLHCRGFMDYHSDRFADCSLVATADDRWVAVLPANRDGDTLYSHQGLTYGGWLVPYKHADVTTMLEVSQQALAWCRAHGITHVVHKPVPTIYHRYPADDDVYALFRAGARWTGCNVSTAIDLAEPLALDRGTRSAVNAASKAGIAVAQSDDWAGYWTMLEQLLDSRYHTRPVHSVAEMQLLHSRFPHEITLWTATLEGEMLAGVVTFDTGRVLHCQYIASSERGRQLRALSLLLYHLRDEATARGCRYLDYGTSNEQGGHYLNEGLVQQKSRLGGRSVAYNTYQIDL